MDCNTPRRTDFAHPPSQILFIATFLKMHLDLHVEILDLAQKLTLENRERKLKDFLSEYGDFKYFGVSCYSSSLFLDSIFLGNIIREMYPNSCIFVGGRHPTIFPNDFIFPTSPFDYIFVGEAEVELYKLLKKLINYFKRPIESRIINCEPLSVDNFVNIDWSLAESFDYIKNPNPNVFVFFPIFLSRGCSFRCNFCQDSNNPLTECYRKIRRLPFKMAIDSLLSLNERFKDRKNLFYVASISDPLFGDYNFRIKLYKELIKKDPAPYYGAQTRLDLFRPDKEIPYIKKLKMMLEFGMDGGCERMLKIMNKTKNPRKYMNQIVDASKKLDENQIYHAINTIIGHPGETQQSLLQTIEFLKKLVSEKQYLLPHIFRYAWWPGSETYDNKVHYERKYGTQFFFEEWWKYEEQEYTPLLLNPSKEVNFVDITYKFRDFHLDLFRIISKNRIGKRDDMRDFRNKYFFVILMSINSLKKYPNIFLNEVKERFPNLFKFV